MNEPSPSSEKVLKFVPAGERPRFYTFGPFCLDAIDRQLLRHGEVLPLPPKTIETLLVLVQRHGQLVTKEVLMGTLWPETFVEEGSLTQNIFRLRKALGDDSDSERYIETVPRRGYRFVAAVSETEVPSVDNVPTRRAILMRRAVILGTAAAAILVSLAVFVARHSHGSAVTQRPLARAAQEAYLKGRYHFERRTRPDFLKAVEYFRSAVEQEPRYALAWAGLANVYSFLGEAPRAKVAAQRALEIDERLPEAHAALANASMFHDFDWLATEQHLERAIELNPSYATAHHWYAFYLASQGRVDDALREIERARALEPTSLIINTDVADMLFYARRYDEAIVKLREVLALDGNFIQAHQLLSEVYLRAGDYRASAEELPPGAYVAGELYAARGDTAQALDVLHAMEEQFRRDPPPSMAFHIARLHAALGNNDASLDWLEKSLAIRDAGELAMLNVDPGFDRLRGKPLFQALLRRMKLVSATPHWQPVTGKRQPVGRRVSVATP